MSAEPRKDLHTVLDAALTSAPRYTSYPPANYMSTAFGESAWRTAIEAGLREQAPSGSGEISLYMHVPFCKTLCFFCACNRVITKNKAVVEPYLKALIAEIASYQTLLADLPVRQIHMGGGTPNYLSPDQFRELFGALHRALPNSKDGSFSVELDPRTCTSDHLDALGELGCTRVSVGVQDFDPTVQKTVNRIQGFDDTLKLFEHARQRGIRTVAVDLIYGLPRQTRETFTRTLKQVLDLRPERVAVYGYAHVQSVAPGQRAFTAEELPSSHERLDLLIDAIEFFTASGYRYLGMDHFVLPDDPLAAALDRGELGRSFMGYVSDRGVPVIGLGVSSISMLPTALAQNMKDVPEYQAACTPGRIPVERGVLRTPEDRAAGDIIESVLTTGVVDCVELEGVYGPVARTLLAGAESSLQRFEQMGLIVKTANGFKLTYSGQIFGRQVAQTFDYRARQIDRRVPQAQII